MVFFVLYKTKDTMRKFYILIFSILFFSCTQNKHKGYEVFKSNNQYGLKLNGKTIIDATFQELAIVENSKKVFVQAKQNNKFGLLDSLGNVLILCEFDSIYGITDSTTFVMKNKLKGLVKLDGQVIIPSEYESISVDSLGVIILKKNNKYGILLNTADSLIEIVPFVCDRVEQNGFFYIILTKEKYGLIDNLGRVIIPFNFDEIVEIGRIDEEQYFVFRVADKGKYGLFSNRRGNLTDAVYDKIEPFQNKIALIKSGNKWGFIGIRGEILLKPVYDELEQFNDEGDAVYINNGEKGIISRNYLFNQTQQPSSPQIEIQ